MMQVILNGRVPGLENERRLTALPLDASGPSLAGAGIAAWKRSQARDGVQDTIHCQICATVVGGRSMTFIIHAWKADQNIMTVRIGPAVAVDKARELETMGWQVYVTDAAGRRFTPPNFDRLISIARETA
jgi:hypothetical protein